MAEAVGSAFLVARSCELTSITPFAHGGALRDQTATPFSAGCRLVIAFAAAVDFATRVARGNVAGKDSHWASDRSVTALVLLSDISGHQEWDREHW